MWFFNIYFEIQTVRTPTSIIENPIISFGLNCSLKTKAAASPTSTMLPAVIVGCTTFNGNLDSDNAYKIKAMQYSIMPDKSGQFCNNSNRLLKLA